MRREKWTKIVTFHSRMNTACDIINHLAVEPLTVGGLPEEKSREA